jgi:predicted enzyme related to lactoylglutathione lyase
MLLHLESVVLFVPDIDAAAAWYAALLGVQVAHENPRYAFVRTPQGLNIGFHPADAKNPGGVPGTTPYWEVADFDAALALLLARGATLHRGPGVTDFGARVALLIDPFGNTLGLNQAKR